jgi:hypothetical protein
MQLGNAEFGDEGDEGREPPPLGPRVWERRWVSRDAIYWGCTFGFRPGRTARAIAAGSPADKKTGCPRLPPAATACSPPPSCSTTTAQRAVHLSCSRFFFSFCSPPPPSPSQLAHVHPWPRRKSERLCRRAASRRLAAGRRVRLHSCCSYTKHSWYSCTKQCLSRSRSGAAAVAATEFGGLWAARPKVTACADPPLVSYKTTSLSISKPKRCPACAACLLRSYAPEKS